MKKSAALTALLLSLGLLTTACQKQENTPAPAENTAPVQAETPAPAQTDAQSNDHDDHHDHDHDDGHDHDHDHSHEGHAHHHHEGDAYSCGDKTVHIAVHDHEGETEAHATIDDIEYDLHPDTDKPNQYISHEDGINGNGMSMTLDGNNAVFTSMDGKTLLVCEKQAS